MYIPFAGAETNQNILIQYIMWECEF